MEDEVGTPPPGVARSSRALAFYLPQFHPIPLNDEIYGRDFTEWTHVRAAQPLFRGHEQPVVPGELGHYDLRDPALRHRQAELAATHGIEGFVYWHYWSLGDRLLERPFQEVVSSGAPDFGFCVGWANSHWRRIGTDQSEGPILFEQRYSPADDERHFAALETAFHDRRHLTVDGKPLMFIFRPADVTDLAGTCERWRTLALASGLPGLHIVGQGRRETGASLQQLAALDGIVPVDVFPRSGRSLYARLRDRRSAGPARAPHAALLDEFLVDQPALPVESYPCVVTNWDNTPRTGREGLVLTDSSPATVAALTRRAAASVADRPRERRLIFLKSWNEWAEGNYLEPDARWGTARLEAIGRVL